MCVIRACVQFVSEVLKKIKRDKLLMQDKRQLWGVNNYLEIQKHKQGQHYKGIAKISSPGVMIELETILTKEERNEQHGYFKN